MSPECFKVQKSKNITAKKDKNDCDVINDNKDNNEKISE